SCRGRSGRCPHGRSRWATGRCGHGEPATWSFEATGVPGCERGRSPTWETASMSDPVQLFQRAKGEFGRRVDAIKDDQWSAPTPCTEWDVRTLVHHLTYEMVWAPPLFEGKTVADVGDRFEGDILGADPKKAWKDGSAAADGSVGGNG